MIGFGWFDLDIPLRFEWILSAVRVTTFLFCLTLTPRLFISGIKSDFWQYSLLSLGSSMLLVYYFDIIVLTPAQHNLTWATLWYNLGLWLMFFGSATLSSKARVMQETERTETTRKKSVADRWRNRRVK